MCQVTVRVEATTFILEHVEHGETEPEILDAAYSLTPAAETSFETATCTTTVQVTAGGLTITHLEDPYTEPRTIAENYPLILNYATTWNVPMAGMSEQSNDWVYSADAIRASEEMIQVPHGMTMDDM